jgi:excisionase family DNA binding protein
MAELNLKLLSGDLERMIEQVVIETIAHLDKDRYNQAHDTPDGEPLADSGALLLKPRDAAKVLAISERTLWQLTRTGEIPRVLIGRAVRYSTAALNNWIEARTKIGKEQEPELTGSPAE